MSADFVKSGLWSDYSKDGLNRHQILVTDYHAGLITNALAVLITSTAGPIYTIFRHPLHSLWKKISSRWGRPQLDEPDQHELLGEVIESVTGERWQQISLGLPAVPNGPVTPIGYVGVALMLLLLVAPSLGLIAASIVSAGLATTKVGLSSDPSCGDYEFHFNSSRHSEPFLHYERQAEAQAGEYAAKCYGLNSVDSDCNRFVSQNITYSKAQSASCPFDGNVCDIGENGAFSLSTGLQSGLLLGVNAANPYFFGRTVTCAPLLTGESFVREGLSDRGEKQWEYWYGRSLADYTSATPMRDSSWEIKGYSTGVYCYDPTVPDNTFEPLPGVRAGPYPVTLIFISSHSILYPQYRSDPVFPAREKDSFPPDYNGPIYYVNNSTRAGVLGCVDKYQICKTKTGPCWSNNNISSIPQSPKNRNPTEEENVATLLNLALDFSTSCGSVQYRQAEALDAQSKIAHIQSLPLADRQWEVEAEKMFQTSLARMQSNIYDIARGTAKKYEGYENVLDPKYRGICGLVQILTPGHTNVNLWGLLGTSLAVLLLWMYHLRGFIWKKILIPGGAWAWRQMGRLRQSKFCLGCWDLLSKYVLEPFSKLLLDCC